MINRLSKFINKKRIQDDISEISNNKNNKDTLKLPAITFEDERLEMLSTNGYSYIYDIKNDILKINKKDKEINIDYISEDIKELLQKEIINTIREERLSAKKELEVNQQAIYTNIIQNLKNNSYTPHNHFKEINKWKEKDFENFVNKFSNENLQKFKEILKINIKHYEDISIKGDKMNEAFDNIGTDHRRMLNKFENVKVQENKLTQKSKRKI